MVSSRRSRPGFSLLELVVVVVVIAVLSVIAVPSMRHAIDRSRSSSDTASLAAVARQAAALAGFDEGPVTAAHVDVALAECGACTTAGDGVFAGDPWVRDGAADPDGDGDPAVSSAYGVVAVGTDPDGGTALVMASRAEGTWVWAHIDTGYTVTAGTETSSPRAGDVAADPPDAGDDDPDPDDPEQVDPYVMWDFATDPGVMSAGGYAVAAWNSAAETLAGTSTRGNTGSRYLALPVPITTDRPFLAANVTLSGGTHQYGSPTIFRLTPAAGRGITAGAAGVPHIGLYLDHDTDSGPAHANNQPNAAARFWDGSTVVHSAGFHPTGHRVEVYVDQTAGEGVLVVAGAVVQRIPLPNPAAFDTTWDSVEVVDHYTAGGGSSFNISIDDVTATAGVPAGSGPRPANNTLAAYDFTTDPGLRPSTNGATIVAWDGVGALTGSWARTGLGGRVLELGKVIQSPSPYLSTTATIAGGLDQYGTFGQVRLVSPGTVGMLSTTPAGRAHLALTASNDTDSSLLAIGGPIVAAQFWDGITEVYTKSVRANGAKIEVFVDPAAGQGVLRVDGTVVDRVPLANPAAFNRAFTDVEWIDYETAGGGVTNTLRFDDLAVAGAVPAGPAPQAAAVAVDFTTDPGVFVSMNSSAEFTVGYDAAGQRWAGGYHRGGVGGSGFRLGRVVQSPTPYLAANITANGALNTYGSDATLRLVEGATFGKQTGSVAGSAWIGLLTTNDTDYPLAGGVSVRALFWDGAALAGTPFARADGRQFSVWVDAGAGQGVFEADGVEVGRVALGDVSAFAATGFTAVEYADVSSAGGGAAITVAVDDVVTAGVRP